MLLELFIEPVLFLDFLLPAEPPEPFLLFPFLEEATFNVYYFEKDEGLRKSLLSPSAKRFFAESPPVDRLVGDTVDMLSMKFCFGEPPTDSD